MTSFNTTSYEYDGYDRLVRTVYPYGSYERLNLDNAGRIQSKLTRDGRSITYGYDDLDRITSRTIQGAPTDTYTYDLAGRIINAATSGLGTFTHVYDTAGRLTSVIDPNTRTVGYQYDAASNRTRIDYPDGSYAVYAYDEMGRMTHVQYDPNNDTTAPAPSTVATYTYDNLSRRDLATLGNGTTSDPSYSTDGLVADIIHTATGGNVTFTYNHDTSGLVTNLTVSDDLFAPFTDIAGTKSFTPNSLNQYTSAMGEAIVHDLNGNMSSDGSNNYVHDAVNRLITATVGSTTWTYAYGPLDRRMSKADGTNTIAYLYDGDRAVAEYNGSGTLLRKYIYGPGLDEPIMMIVPGDPNETVYYYHSDHLGSVIGLTNDAGAWVEKYAYTLYGKPAAQSTIGNPYMYTGRRFDNETGLYYYRARYYDPNLRRFIETDPIGYAGGMNLYAYVGNSPVNYIDSYGLEGTRARTHITFFGDIVVTYYEPYYKLSPTLQQGVRIHENVHVKQLTPYAKWGWFGNLVYPFHGYEWELEAYEAQLRFIEDKLKCAHRDSREWDQLDEESSRIFWNMRELRNAQERD